jgi:hypothetical protein
LQCKHHVHALREAVAKRAVQVRHVQPDQALAIDHPSCRCSLDRAQTRTDAQVCSHEAHSGMHRTPTKLCLDLLPRCTQSCMSQIREGLLREEHKRAEMWLHFDWHPVVSNGHELILEVIGARRRSLAFDS